MTENTGFAQLQVEAARLDSKLSHEIAGLAGAKRTTRKSKITVKIKVQQTQHNYACFYACA